MYKFLIGYEGAMNNTYKKGNSVNKMTKIEPFITILDKSVVTDEEYRNKNVC